MYLLTFPFLIIGMLGIFAQVMGVEATRTYANQTGIGQDMVYWHEAAVSVAANVVHPASMGTGCSLTPTIIQGFNFCQIGLNITAHPYDNGYATVSTTTTYTTPSGTYPSLPQGFSTAYEWNSVAFSNEGYYVLTYANAPSAGSGFVSTATTTLGITDSDLYRQIRQSGVPITNFGYVTSGDSTGRMLVTSATVYGTPVEYKIPSTVPLGVFALISSTSVCNGC